GRLMKNIFAALLLVAITGNPPAQDTASFDKLAADFWTWRATYAPFNGDDVTRMESLGGTRDWSRVSIDKRRKDLAEFESRWKKIDASKWPIASQVDYRLIGSTLSRVRWELDINPRWKRDPTFYLEQTLTPIVEALTVPAPYHEAQSREILTRIENVPSILEQAGLRFVVRRRSKEHTSELQSLAYLVCRLLLEKKKYEGIPV